MLSFSFVLYFLIQFFFFFSSWRLITLQYCSGFCHTLTWISHGFTCISHPDPPSHLPLYLISLGLSSAPGPNTCLMHPTFSYSLKSSFIGYLKGYWKQQGEIDTMVPGLSSYQSHLVIVTINDILVTQSLKQSPWKHLIITERH